MLHCGFKGGLNVTSLHYVIFLVGEGALEHIGGQCFQKDVSENEMYKTYTFFKMCVCVLTILSW
jgi:hypothetical protein